MRQTCLPERSCEEFSHGHTMLTVNSLAGVCVCVWRGGPVQEIVCIRVPTRSRSPNQDRKLRWNSAKLLAIVMFVHQGGAAAACKVTGLQGLATAQPWADSYRTGQGQDAGALLWEPGERVGDTSKRHDRVG